MTAPESILPAAEMACPAAERAVLGAVLLEPSALYEVQEALGVEDFTDPLCRRTYAAMLRLAGRREPCDVVSVTEALRETDELERVGGPTFLTTLTDDVASAATIRTHARLIETAARRRRIEACCRRGLAAIRQPGVDPLAASESIIREVQAAGEPRDAAVAEAISSVLARTLRDLEARRGTDGVSGLRTGLSKLDELTGGFQPGELVVLGARPRMGKTALALGISRHAAVEEGKSVLFFSLEMGSLALGARILAAGSRVPTNRFRTGDMSGAEWGALIDAAGDIGEPRLLICEDPRLDLPATCQLARRAHREHPLGLIAVDYVQLLRVPGRRYDMREREVAEISRSLKVLAKELDVPVLALAQLNRRVEDRENKRPQLGDLRESGALEQDADVVLFLWRPHVYEPSKPPGLAYLACAKQRNGEEGLLELRFDPPTASFRDPDGE